jgi:hypothetical protein
MGMARKAAIGAVGGLCLGILKLIDAKFFLMTASSTEMFVGYLTYFSFLLLGMAVAAFLAEDDPELHGELSTTDTFANPQSREIDVLLEFELPQRIRLLISGKDSEHRQKLEHVGDYEGLLASLRSNDDGWLYWAMIVARKGFQSGCEETAKRADIALVPPLTGSVDWLSVLTEEEIFDRVADAVRIFTLGDAWRRDATSYRTGDVYNSIYVGTREPSGLPGTTRIRQPDGSEKPMKTFVEEALAKPENRFRIPLSRDRTYVPFFAPPMVQSAAKDGTLKSNAVASTIIASSRGMRFFLAPKGRSAK